MIHERNNIRVYLYLSLVSNLIQLQNFNKRLKHTIINCYCFPSFIFELTYFHSLIFRIIVFSVWYIWTYLYSCSYTSSF